MSKTFEITAPDGRTFEVTGPDNATREDALKQVQAKYAAPTPVKLGAEGLPDAIKEVAGGTGFRDKAMIGAAGAINEAAMRLKEALGRDLTPEDIQGLSEYKALEEASGAATAGKIGMSVLATMQPGALIYNFGKNALTAGAKAFPQIPGAVARFIAPAGGAAASGAAVTAATDPEDIAAGTAGSVIADTLTRGASRLARPIVQSEAVQKLTKEGIVPTIGQAAGGFLNRVEQQLESVPVVGWMISGARKRAVKEMDEAAIRKALPAGTTEQIKAGRDGIERAGEIMDGAYDRAYGALKGRYTDDKPFQNVLKDIPNREGIDLPPSLKERFDQLINDRVTARLEKGATGEQVREIHNSLGALARKFRSSPDPDQRALGEAFAEAKKEFRESITRQTTDGTFKKTLDALDGKYANLLAVEKASGYSGAKDGIFSPSQLERASKRSPEMREFAKEASDVLGPTVRDSGTAGRLLLPVGASMAGGGNEMMGGPGWLTGALAAPLLYSRLGSRYATGGLPGQQTLAEMIRAATPYTSQLGRSIGTRN